MMKILLFFTLIHLKTFAQTSVLTFCHSDKKTLRKSLEFIKTPSEKISQLDDKSCLDLIVKEHRKELVERYIKNKLNIYPKVFKRRHCHLEITKKISVEANNKEISIYNPTKISNGQSKKRTIETQTIKILENEFNDISNDKLSYQIKCRIINNGQYELQVKISSRDDKTIWLSTSRLTSKHKKTSLGSFSKHSDKNNREISTRFGLKRSTEIKQKLENTYITVR